MEESQTRKADYKWVIVVLCFMMVFVCLGFCSSNKSLYTFAITGALGIPRSSFSLNDSCRFITTAIVNMFFGSLVSKFGTKKLICAGFVSLILSCLAYSVATNVFVIYLGGCLLGIGLAWTTTTMVGCVVNKWCKEILMTQK
jgi:MFS family permease